MESNNLPASENIKNVQVKQSNPLVLLLITGCMCLILGTIIGYMIQFILPHSQKIQATNTITKTKSLINSSNFTINDIDMQIKLDGILDKDLANAQYTTIPNTILQVKLPSSFSVVKNREDSWLVFTPIISLDGSDSMLPQFYKDYASCTKSSSSNGQVPTRASYVTSAYCQQLTKSLTTNQILDIEGNAHYHWEYFNIGVVKTDLSPTEWIGDNDLNQGQTLKQMELDSTKWLQTIKVSDEKFDYHVTMFSRDVGCCGGYETVYIYPYTNSNNEKMLILFVSPDKKLLNRILQTFVASAPDRKNI